MKNLNIPEEQSDTIEQGLIIEELRLIDLQMLKLSMYEDMRNSIATDGYISETNKLIDVIDGIIDRLNDGKIVCEQSF